MTVLLRYYTIKKFILAVLIIIASTFSLCLNSRNIHTYIFSEHIVALLHNLRSTVYSICL